MIGILKNNNEIKEKIKEIDDMIFQEEKFIKSLKDEKTKNLTEYSSKEKEYKFLHFFD